MAKKLTVKEAEKITMENVAEIASAVVAVAEDIRPKIHPITQEFGNGDLNTLRDKINEIIASK